MTSTALEPSKALDELGPVDYLVVEFPAGASNFTGEMAKELLALVDSGTIRVIDVLILSKSEDGSVEATELSEQPLLDGLTDGELADLAALGAIKAYQAGEKIIASGDLATSLFFLRSGVVHVTLPDGIRLATLTAGMAFGEMALLEPRRSADVFADMAATAYEIPLRDFERFRKQHPRAGERIMRNLAQLLADRLILANAKLNLLTSG